ncbi:hypothetical protein ACEPAF_5695 [Sanghuangporus sanghuang]
MDLASISLFANCASQYGEEDAIAGIVSLDVALRLGNGLMSEVNGIPAIDASTLAQRVPRLSKHLALSWKFS